MKAIRVLLAVMGGFLALSGVALGVVWAVGGSGGGGGTGELKISVYHKPTLMTVAYKAYGNKEAADGKYWLAKLVLENTGKAPIRDLKVSFQIPDYLAWTTPDSHAEVLPGQAVVMPFYPKLPSKVSQIRSRTPATLEVKVQYHDGDRDVEKIEKRDFALRGVTEIEYTSLDQSEIVNWYDVFDNYELLAAFVTDEDEVVKAYFGKISETMGGTPYVSDRDGLLKAMNAIYAFQVGTGMVYMGAKGVPEQIGDRSAMVQSIKLPREIIKSNSGTCIELSAMWCALLPQVGIKTYMVLIPGHAFILAEGPDGTTIPFECTGIGGQNLGGTMKFAEAVESAAKSWSKVANGETPGVLIDMAKYQAQGIRPPELESMEAGSLARLLDDRVNRARGGAQTQPQVVVIQPPNNNPNIVPAPGPAPGPGPQPLPAGFQQWRDPTGVLTIAYPGQWQVNGAMVQQLQTIAPWYQFNATDATTLAAVEVYVFPTNNPQACTQTMAQFAQQIGLRMQFGQARQGALGGRQSVIVPVQYVSQQGQGVSEMHMVPVGNVTYVVSVGALNQTYQQSAPMLNAILANSRIGQ